MIISATLYFSLLSVDVSCLPPGPALEDDVLFPSRFSPLLLVVDLDETVRNPL